MPKKRNPANQLAGSNFQYSIFNNIKQSTSYILLSSALHYQDVSFYFLRIRSNRLQNNKLSNRLRMQVYVYTRDLKTIYHGK
jgi:hypothetical protein